MVKNLTKSNINEGLRSGDLRDLLLPLISIDEYESKISTMDEIMVVGFYVEIEDAANDLSKFINRSANQMIDTAVSPAPTESGYFVVFVEIERNSESFSNINAILYEIENVVSISPNEWKFKGYQANQVLDFNEENFNNVIRIEESTHESFKLNKFFSNSLVESFEITNDKYVTINNITLKINDFKSLQESIPSASFEDLSLSRKLDKILGLHYSASVLGNTVQINNLSRGETIYATVT